MLDRSHLKGPPVDARKLSRFEHAETLLACPVCHEPLELSGAALSCVNRHSFDVARQGYVNLLRGGKQPQGYDRSSFEQRRRVFESGLYDNIAQALCDAVEALSPSLPVVDAGCGEGFFAHAVRRATGAGVCAFDISRDSVQLAAAQDPEDGIAWLVADLASIPLQDGRAGCVLDVFSPANYHEFKRILAPRGRIVKVVPTARHLHELRELAAASLRHQEYSNQRVIDHFAASCVLDSRATVSLTLKLDDHAIEALIAMTPLLFHVDTGAIDWSGIESVTVEADVLVGHF